MKILKNQFFRLGEDRISIQHQRFDVIVEKRNVAELIEVIPIEIILHPFVIICGGRQKG